MNNTPHRYTLQPYTGPSSRYCCPQCNHRTKTFSRYIDTETNEQLAGHVGWCSRENNCGYHIKPSDYFGTINNRQHSFSKDAHLWLGDRSIVDSSWTIAGKNHYVPSTIDHGLIHPDIVNASFNVKDYAQNNFVQYLITLFGFDKADELVGRYRIGTSKHWHGATVFWQVDIRGNARTGKIMLYNKQTGKRVKEPFNHITWAHRLLRKSESRESPASLKDAAIVANRSVLPLNEADHLPDFRSPGLSDFHLKQCLFGEHLLTEASPAAVVAIVESEKTAIMGSAFMPEYTWLATGGISNLTIDNCKVLNGHTVLLFPDVNAYDKWKAKAGAIRLQMPGVTFKIFKQLEKLANADEKRLGLDLGDVFAGLG